MGSPQATHHMWGWKGIAHGVEDSIFSSQSRAKIYSYIGFTGEEWSRKDWPASVSRVRNVICLHRSLPVPSRSVSRGFSVRLAHELALFRLSVPPRAGVVIDTDSRLAQTSRFSDDWAMRVRSKLELPEHGEQEHKREGRLEVSGGTSRRLKPYRRMVLNARF